MPPPLRTWKLFHDYNAAPGAGSNPGPDSYGNPKVWWYGTGPVGSGGFLPLFDFNPNRDGIPLYESFEFQAVSPVPYVAFNRTGGPISIPASPGGPINVPKNMVLVVPGSSPYCAAVVGWTSPTAGKFKVNATMSMAQSPGCGNGVKWWLMIDGSTVLLNGSLNPGQSINWNTTSTTTAGHHLDLEVDSDGDVSCDAMLLKYKVRAP